MNFDIKDSLLGKQASNPERYDASLLFRIPRAENRMHYDLDAKALPFTGVDVWNCYELSFMTDNGLPVSRVLKLIYAAESEFLVESKSLKLYLNSFNMEAFGKTIDEALQKVQQTITHDLSVLLETEVIAVLLSEKDQELVPFVNLPQLTDLMPEEQLLAAEFSHYLETPELLKGTRTDTARRYAFRSDLLRSNCRVTNQPDWGDLFVVMEAECDIDLVSVVAYLVSFRKENHFHEEVVEMIYKRFYDIFSPKKLMVAAMYTRRGGIDINPLRASHVEMIDEAFVSRECRLGKTLRQ